MPERAFRFRHEVIDDAPPGSMLDITLLTDVNGDGRPDIVIGGKEGAVNLFWYENPAWRRHEMASAPQLEAGGLAVDLTGTGRPDIIAGQQMQSHKLFWFENPPDPAGAWPVRVIDDRWEKYHDQAMGDVDGDGEPELVFASQVSRILAYYDIPDDPREEPWPRDRCHLIAEGLGQELEGLVVLDIDGDGRQELLAGPNVYRRDDGGHWESSCFAPDFVQTRVAAADLDGDGRTEIVLCEGESNPGRLAVCRPPEFRPEVLRDDLFHPHSLQLADFDGDGLTDIFVAEMGLDKNPEPRMFIYRNLGSLRFEEHVIHTGTATHEAKAADLTGNGRPDVVGKPYAGPPRVDVWFNE
jgi:hypothetical protein